MHKKSEYLKQIVSMTQPELENELAKIEARIMRRKTFIAKGMNDEKPKNTSEIDKWKRSQLLRQIKQKGGK